MRVAEKLPHVAVARMTPVSNSARRLRRFASTLSGGHMATGKLNGKRVAILATDGVEQSELTEPRKALDDAGARTTLISPKNGAIKAWQHDRWGEEFRVDQPLEQADANNFDALFLPGGVMNPDRLRINRDAVE